MKGYYSKEWGSDISVNRTMYLGDGTETTSASQAKKFVYHIKVKKLITGKSIAAIRVIRFTTARLKIDYPTQV